MRIGLHNGDGGSFPNLALMKLSSWHKSKGDEVELWSPISAVDRVYSSRVFTWSTRNTYLPDDVEEGGSAVDLGRWLPDEVEHSRPDYELFKVDHGIGFLTRGCSNFCSWCVVPDKEGGIAGHAEYAEFLHPSSRDLVLLDNNVLSSGHGIRQIELMADAGLRIDFLQGLDARLIAGEPRLAGLLARCRWRRFIRMACDTQAMMAPVEWAVEMIRQYSGRKMSRSSFMVYVLVTDVEDALERVEFLRGLEVTPFAQPLRTAESPVPTDEQKRFSRWVNRPAAFHATSWSDYSRPSRAGVVSPDQRPLFGARE